MACREGAVQEIGSVVWFSSGKVDLGYELTVSSETVLVNRQQLETAGR